MFYPFFPPRATMNNQPILFVSSRCSHSKQILETLNAMNKASLCRILPIDGKQRHELPDFLKSVPTLYVPETKDVYIGKDIYAYIAKPVSARREIPTSAPKTAAGVAQGGGGGAPPQDLQAWSFSGTGSLTESYSSWDNPSRFSTDDQLQYSYLGGPIATPVKPEPETKQSYDGNKQGRNDDISSRLEAYKKARDTEFKGIARQ
jgi:hypothetical protein